jgi:hypothetical protein
VSEPPIPENGPEGAPSTLLRLLPIWLCLAAAAQLIYLCHWPLYVFGSPISWTGSIFVALVRLAIYTGLAWGLVRRERTAWAGTVLELGRSFLLFAVEMALQGWSLPGASYPAGWAQGLLSAALPVVLAVSTALAAGWRPGPALDRQIEIAARIFGGLAGLSALWLRKDGTFFDGGKPDSGRALVLRGLPVVLVLAACEAAAYLLARR